MPTIGWNLQWAAHMRQRLGEGIANVYGEEWGDPETRQDLHSVVVRYIHPYVTRESIVLEIGCGGGRWTTYLREAGKLILVDLNPEFFYTLLGQLPSGVLSKARFYRTDGYELHGIASASVDFVFSFDTLVHIDPGGIAEYMSHIARVLRYGGHAVLHYADKTKQAGRENPGYSDMNAQQMEVFARAEGFSVLEHDTELLIGSNVIVLQRGVASTDPHAPAVDGVDGAKTPTAGWDDKEIFEENLRILRREREKFLAQWKAERVAHEEHLRLLLREREGQLAPAHGDRTRTVPLRRLGGFVASWSAPYGIFAFFKECWVRVGSPFPTIVRRLRHRIFGRLWPAHP